MVRAYASSGWQDRHVSQRPVMSPGRQRGSRPLIKFCQELREKSVACNGAVALEPLYLNSAVVHEFDFPPLTRRCDYDHNGIPHTVESIRGAMCIEDVDELHQIYR